MSLSKYLALGLSGFLYGCALLAGLDDKPGDLGPVQPTTRTPGDPENGDPSAPSTTKPKTAPEVVTPASGVVAIATDDAAVYYATRRELLSVGVTPGSPPRLLLDDDVAASRAGDGELGVHPLQLLGVAVNRSRVFVVDDTWGRVFACPKAGCAPDRGATIRMTGLAVPNGQIAVDESLVAWGELLGIGISTMPQGEEEISAKYGPTGSGEPKRIVSAVVGGKGAGVWLTDKSILYAAAPRAETRMVSEPAVTDFAIKEGTSLAYGINGATVFEIDTKSPTKSRFADVPGVVLKRIVADGIGIYVVGERPDKAMELFEVQKDRVQLVAHLTSVKALALGKTFVFFADDDAIFRVAR